MGFLNNKKKYSAEEILGLVRNEIDHSNRIIGRKKLSTTDYIVIGIVTEALKRDELLTLPKETKK